jgi:hypothetical protein
MCTPAGAARNVHMACCRYIVLLIFDTAHTLSSTTFSQCSLQDSPTHQGVMGTETHEFLMNNPVERSTLLRMDLQMSLQRVFSAEFATTFGTWRGGRGPMPLFCRADHAVQLLATLRRHRYPSIWKCYAAVTQSTSDAWSEMLFDTTA